MSTSFQLKTAKAGIASAVAPHAHRRRRRTSGTASVIVATLMTFGFAVPTNAQDGFKLPNLNPFRTAETQPGSFRANDEPASSSHGFQLPKLSTAALPKPNLPNFPSLTMPKFPKLTPMTERSTGPSPWTRLSRGTKDLFAKTKSTLMPWSGKRPASSRTAQNPRVAGQPSFLSNLFGTDRKDPEINSVTDYIALPRPSPYDD